MQLRFCLVYIFVFFLVTNYILYCTLLPWVCLELRTDIILFLPQLYYSPKPLLRSPWAEKINLGKWNALTLFFRVYLRNGSHWLFLPQDFHQLDSLLLSPWGKKEMKSLRQQLQKAKQDNSKLWSNNSNLSPNRSNSALKLSPTIVTTSTSFADILTHQGHINKIQITGATETVIELVTRVDNDRTRVR